MKSNKHKKSEAARLLGSISTKAKAASSRINGALGGRPVIDPCGCGHGKRRHIATGKCTAQDCDCAKYLAVPEHRGRKPALVGA